MTCPHCGAPLSGPKCEYCGSLVPEFQEGAKLSGQRPPETWEELIALSPPAPSSPARSDWAFMTLMYSCLELWPLFLILFLYYEPGELLEPFETDPPIALWLYWAYITLVWFGTMFKWLRSKVVYAAEFCRAMRAVSSGYGSFYRFDAYFCQQAKENTFYLSATPDRPHWDFAVTFLFLGKQKLRPGQKVTIVGTYKGLTEEGILQFEGCGLLAVEPAQVPPGSSNAPLHPRKRSMPPSSL